MLGTPAPAAAPPHGSFIGGMVVAGDDVVGVVLVVAAGDPHGFGMAVPVAPARESLR